MSSPVTMDLRRRVVRERAQQGPVCVLCPEGAAPVGGVVDGLCGDHRARLAGIGAGRRTATLRQKERLDPQGSERRRQQLLAEMFGCLTDRHAALDAERLASTRALPRRDRRRMWARQGNERHAAANREKARAYYAATAEIQRLEEALYRATHLHQVREANRIKKDLEAEQLGRRRRTPWAPRERPCPVCTDPMPYTAKPPRQCDACYAREAERLEAELDERRVAIGLPRWRDRHRGGHRLHGTQRIGGRAPAPTLTESQAA
jgi:hypothetical protein